MANRLAKLTLSVSNREENEPYVNVYHGEVVSTDSDLKTNAYRFYETDYGTLLVSIDYSKEKIVIQERSQIVNMTIHLQKDKVCSCNLVLEEGEIRLSTKGVEINISENNIKLEYQVYVPNDLENYITKNRIEIDCEVDNSCSTLN
ncbi:MAG: hypothetical protein E7180_04210 [Erysipelotrichaceae bacterium]|nr:hypothetical protein [Erysipelotrichaceae bacterium]